MWLSLAACACVALICCFGLRLINSAQNVKLLNMTKSDLENSLELFRCYRAITQYNKSKKTGWGCMFLAKNIVRLFMSVHIFVVVLYVTYWHIRQQRTAWLRGLLLCPAPIAGVLSDDACLTSVWRLSVAYIGPMSITERPRKTKIGTEVSHVTCDSDTTFKVNLHGAGAYCGGLQHSLLLY